MDDLHDYSTTRGRIRQCFSRIQLKWIILPLLVIGIFVLPFFFVQPENEENKLQNGLLTSSSSSNSKSNVNYIFEGRLNTLVTFSNYEEIMSGKTTTKTVTLRNVIIDAPLLSSSLQGFTNLESLTLENVSLMGNFTRVFLPKLAKFSYQQNRDDKRDSYKSPETLKSTLFFDKLPNKTWSVEVDLLHLGMEIKISKAGTKLIEINRASGEIYLNVKYCQNILRNARGFPTTSLTIITCNVTAEDVITSTPTHLKYLNMRNAITSTEILSSILKSQTILSEFYAWFNFYCDWPGFEIFLELSELPRSIKKVGLNNMDLKSKPGFKSTITDLSIGDFINEDIVERFHEIFVNIKHVAIFNISAKYAYPLLLNALKTNVESISLIMFDRVGGNSEGNTSTYIMNENIQSSVAEEVDHILTSLGVSTNESDIMIELNGGKAKSARMLSTEEQHYIRYIGLGFDKMDTLEDYLLWDSLKLSSNKSHGRRFTVNVLAMGFIMTAFITISIYLQY